ncbi:hypothetical protein DIZ81_13210 [Legionella taurinensis]|uniref:Uncharacterized protein n=1 Tax=Legionella taurinensis TaxID=70611 RepID=A0AB38N3P6_9GAMM|nr:hypothetical protein DB744_13220 [Legionella taurinensis]PUT40109.1 hypothetical protein DB746_12620 [Legionella taurinensis]PUT42261.1 hypothetical protein DB743_13105 [Legionella taurinensis]PUT46033.1 hypothetical protein DB745_12075 [Legionella taurinensis]TID31653.1 hypothetical protein DIZ41_13105 [Legionella taurinensis]
MSITCIDQFEVTINDHVRPIMFCIVMPCSHDLHALPPASAKFKLSFIMYLKTVLFVMASNP